LAAAAGSFLRYLDRRPKELFFSDKPRSEDNFQTQTQKIHPIDTKDSKIQ
jgi:hypothetical protein